MECPPPGVGQAIPLPPDPTKAPPPPPATEYFKAEQQRWIAGFPNVVTAAKAVEMMEEVIKFAQALIRKIAWSFKGTVPPPPWPSPELYEAIDRAQKMRDGFEVLNDKAGTAARWSRNHALIQKAIEVGNDVWNKSSKLEARWQYVKSRPAGTAIKEEIIDPALNLLPTPKLNLWWIAGGAIVAGYLLTKVAQTMDSASRLRTSFTS